MQYQSWKSKIVQAAGLIVVISVGARIAYEAARPLIAPAVVLLFLAGLFSLLARRR